MKIKKKFQYMGIELRIVEREEENMSYTGILTKRKATRVLAPNDGIIPIHIQYKQTLKSIAEETCKILDNFKKTGADIESELLM